MIIQLKLRRVWLAIPEYTQQYSYFPKTSVAVIIPARNEAKNIKKCLESILNQNYPKDLINIVLVDDYSTDRTLEFARSFEDRSIQVIALEDEAVEESLSPKKRALNLGISRTSAKLIITTDADCIAGEDWIRSIVQYYETQEVDMIAGPVLFDPLNSSFDL